MDETHIFILRLIAALVLPILLFQALRSRNFSKNDLFKYKIRWLIIVFLSVFICLGLRTTDSDPLEFNPDHQLSSAIKIEEQVKHNHDEILAVERDTLKIKRDLLRLDDFYTFIPLAFCFGTAIYAVSQILFGEKKDKLFTEVSNK